jgi:hypothetical protein
MFFWLTVELKEETKNDLNGAQVQALNITLRKY